MQVSQDTLTTFDYTLKDDAGEVIDSSQEHSPLSYLHGHGELIPGLEKALEGKESGQSFAVSLSPEQGYGPYQDHLIFEIPKERFQDPGQLQPGLQIRLRDNHGQHLIAKITEVRDNEVIVDGNHPLAGANLHFDITIKEIRKATEEEIQQRLQGHQCHGGHCHHEDHDCDKDSHCNDDKGGCHCH
jgi:FKBP-type peptidyl-prolyl cis-trans isomerase SlyD